MSVKEQTCNYYSGYSGNLSQEIFS